MEFEWDYEKNKRNIQKHNFDFADVTKIFEYPVLEFQDTRKEYGEKRIFGIGILQNVEISIIYTKRKSIVRIISARRARKDERKKYRALFPEQYS